MVGKDAGRDADFVGVIYAELIKACDLVNDLAQLARGPRSRLLTCSEGRSLLLPAPFGGFPVSAAIRVEAIEEVHHRVDDVGVALGQSR